MNQRDKDVRYSIVSWREIQGNKYSKSIHPAMLSDGGFRKTQKASLIGNPKGNTEFITVIYDKSYVIKWIEKKLIKPLENNSYKVIGKLVFQAYSNVKNPPIEQLDVLPKKQVNE